jgi:hypothetical protein
VSPCAGDWRWVDVPAGAAFVTALLLWRTETSVPSSVGDA